MGNKVKKKLNNDDKKKMRGPWLSLTAFFSLSIAGIILSIICLANTYIPFIKQNYWVCVALFIFLFCAMCGVAIWVVLLDKNMAVKILFSIYFFVLFCLALILIFQKTGFFEVVASAEGVQAYLEKAGIWMPVLYILLQYISLSQSE